MIKIVLKAIILIFFLTIFLPIVLAEDQVSSIHPDVNLLTRMSNTIIPEAISAPVVSGVRDPVFDGNNLPFGTIVPSGRPGIQPAISPSVDIQADPSFLTDVNPGTRDDQGNRTSSLGTVSAPGSESYVFVTKWGSPGSGDGKFSYPYGVAVDSLGNVYVADSRNSRVQKFNSTGTYLANLGSPLKNPVGVTIDSLDNVYVADSQNNQILIFNSSGSFLAKWGSTGSTNGQFRYPYGVAVDSLGNVYVADTDNHRVQKFSSTGTFISTWGSQGDAHGLFMNPIGIAVDSLDNVYVADKDNNRIQKFSSTGAFIATWGSLGDTPGLFNFPSGIAVDSLDNVFVTDMNNRRIQKFSSTGTFISTWGAKGSGNGQFMFPFGIAVDTSGDVYVVDYYYERIQKFTLELTITSITPSTAPNSGPVTITNLTGTNFKTGATVTLTRSGSANITATDVMVTPTKITCTFPITEASPGEWNVEVANPDGQVCTKVGGFTITPTPSSPTITKISPTLGYNSKNIAATITGNYFQPKATVKLTKGSVTKVAAVGKVTSTQITCTLPLTGMGAGVYSLTVRNPDGKSVTKSNAFTVRAAGKKPTLKSITPHVSSSRKNTAVTITGTNFRSGVVVQMIKGTSVKKATIIRRTATKIICSFLTKGATTGKWNVKITNKDGTSIMKTGAFTVKRTSSVNVTENQPVSGRDSSSLVSVPSSSGLSRGRTLSYGALTPTNEPIMRAYRFPDSVPE